jgi:hypothetical protein
MTIPAISLTTEKRHLKRVRRAEKRRAVILPTIHNELRKPAKKVVKLRVDGNQALINLAAAREVAVVVTSPMIHNEHQRPVGKVGRLQVVSGQATLINLEAARKVVAAETLPIIRIKRLKRGVKEANRAVVEIVNRDVVCSHQAPDDPGLG